MATRKPIIAGNWKLNTDLPTAVKLAEDVRSWADKVDTSKVDIVVVPPYPFIRAVDESVGENVEVGAQTVFYEDKGAYTAAVSVGMLKSVGKKIYELI